MHANSLRSLIGSTAKRIENDAAPTLNGREHAVLKGVFEGLTNKEISSRLETQGAMLRRSFNSSLPRLGCGLEVSLYAWR